MNKYKYKYKYVGRIMMIISGSGLLFLLWMLFPPSETTTTIRASDQPSIEERHEKGLYRSDWEWIDSTGEFKLNTYRLRVPRGWLVRCVNYHSSKAGAMVFVLDENHSWKIVLK